MNTKLVLTASAITLGIAGVICTFVPEEILRYAGMDATKQYQLFVQIFGALYFGFAMLNWMTRDTVIGGIYNRPIAIANFTHYAIAALALVKAVFANPGITPFFWIIAGSYTVFAVCFGIIFTSHPSKT